MAHPQDSRESPSPVSPNRTWFRFLKAILRFHLMFLSIRPTHASTLFVLAAEQCRCEDNRPQHDQ